jgi:hypothetical protein
MMQLDTLKAATAQSSAPIQRSLRESPPPPPSPPPLPSTATPTSLLPLPCAHHPTPQSAARTHPLQRPAGRRLLCRRAHRPHQPVLLSQSGGGNDNSGGGGGIRIVFHGHPTASPAQPAADALTPRGRRTTTTETRAARPSWVGGGGRRRRRSSQRAGGPGAGRRAVRWPAAARRRLALHSFEQASHAGPARSLGPGRVGPCRAGSEDMVHLPAAARGSQSTRPLAHMRLRRAPRALGS